MVGKRYYSKTQKISVTDQERKDLVANTAILVAQNSKDNKDVFANMERTHKEISQKIKDLVAKMDCSDKKEARERKEINRQIGELHREWGIFTEVLLMPSIEKTLYNKFGIGVTAANYRGRRDRT